MCASGLNPLCSAYGHPFSTEASDVVVSNLELKQFLFSRFTRRPHRSVIGARIFCLSSEPKRAFLWRLQTFLPNFFSDLLCLSCQISPRSPPRPSGSIQVILVCSLLLGTETDVQPSVFKWLFFSAAYLFSIPASFCPSPPRLALPALPVRPRGPRERAPHMPHCCFSHPGTRSPSCSSLIRFVPSSSSLCVERNESSQPPPLCPQLLSAASVQHVYL